MSIKEKPDIWINVNKNDCGIITILVASQMKAELSYLKITGHKPREFYWNENIQWFSCAQKVKTDQLSTPKTRMFVPNFLGSSQNDRNTVRNRNNGGEIERENVTNKKRQESRGKKKQEK